MLPLLTVKSKLTIIFVVPTLIFFITCDWKIHHEELYVRVICIGLFVDVTSFLFQLNDHFVGFFFFFPFRDQMVF